MRCGLKTLGVNVLVATIVILWISTRITGPSAPAFADPNPNSDLRIVALGDSYISGEGASQFFAGTDSPGTNVCRRAPSAYPNQIAISLHASLVFAACSGATTDDILARAQEPTVDPYISGGEPQIQVLSRNQQANIVLLSIGGNDAGFGSIAANCTVRGDCRRNAAFWMQSLDSYVYPRLVRTFDAVRSAAPSAQVFVMTYPAPLGRQHCSLASTK